MNLPFHPASPASVAAFLAICAGVLAAFWRGVWLGTRAEGGRPGSAVLATAAATLVWLGLLAAVVASGWLEREPSRLLVLFPTVLGVSLVIGLSPLGRRLSLCSIPLLLAFQGFRLPLELVLHAWVKQGVIPETMTWSGANWDIVSGVVALTLAPFASRSRAAAWIGNLVGLALLINVGRVAIFSAPVPFGWAEVTPKLLLPLHLPYALILPVCVGGALIGHVALTRALLKRS